MNQTDTRRAAWIVTLMAVWCLVCGWSLGAAAVALYAGILLERGYGRGGRLR